jgi:hypothetical protein
MGKYQAANASKCEGLLAFIDDELETMFKAPKFNERDLVNIDKKIRNFIKTAKLAQLNLLN